MNRDPAAADHLGELDARFEGHLSELRERAARSSERLARQAALLRESAAPAEMPPPPAEPPLGDDFLDFK